MFESLFGSENKKPMASISSDKNYGYAPVIEEKMIEIVGKISLKDIFNSKENKYKTLVICDYFHFINQGCSLQIKKHDIIIAETIMISTSNGHQYEYVMSNGLIVCLKYENNKFVIEFLSGTSFNVNSNKWL